MACSFLTWIFLLVPHLQMCCSQACRIKKVISQGNFLSNQGDSCSRLPAQNQYNLNSYLAKKCYKGCECSQAPDYASIWIQEYLFGNLVFSPPPPLFPSPAQIIVTLVWWAVANKNSRTDFRLAWELCFPIYPSRQIIPKIYFNEFWYHSLPFIS